MSAAPPVDPGLQPERTELAWRRTVLSVLVGGLLSLRLLPPALGAWAFAACLAGLALTAVLWVLAQQRAAQVHEALLHDRALPGGAPLLLLSGLTSAGSLLGLAYVATR
jgi:uncharacterized membrane protein YidH (DUF202 family)